MILDWLKSGKTLTQLQSFILCKDFRLASVVGKLKARGYNIESIKVKGAEYVKYKLLK